MSAFGSRADIQSENGARRSIGATQRRQLMSSFYKLLLLALAAYAAVSVIRHFIVPDVVPIAFAEGT